MSGRTFFGTILIILGFAFLLDQLNIIEFGELIGTYWPLILVIIGSYHMVKKNIKPTSGFILIVIGVLFQLKELNILTSDIWKYFWPILLIIVGLNIIFSRNSKSNIYVHNEDRVDHFVVFSGISTKNNSKQFKGGSAFALFGGIDLDLTDAEIAEKNVRLDLTVAFGGIDIKVPEHWKVIAKGIPLFGGWENGTKLKNKNPEQDTPILYVHCLAMFGGIDIKNLN